ncbi:MAG TPA: hypothetical protein VH063_03465 [Gaiellaceae bacterium]|jgi:hypothetical protein|nr:hypothetical protein [Gaiellaceae bacterium]
MSFPADWQSSTDTDADGIRDTLEEALAERFAPVIFMSANEENLPCSVPWFLARAHLLYFENCFPTDTVETVPGAPAPIGAPAALVGAPPYAHPDTWRSHGDSNHPSTHCGSAPEHAPISTVEPHPLGRGDNSTTDDTQTAFIFDDLEGSDRHGSPNVGDWVTYTHVYPRSGGGVTIQYWHVFAYNGLGVAGVGDHGGDWDATVHVQLGANLQPEGVVLSRHSHDSPGDSFTWAQMANGGSVYGGTHPMIVIDGGGHASFANPAWDMGAGSIIGGDLSGWQADPDSPASPCIVWKTWPGQTVETKGTLTVPLTSNGPTPPFVNLGEYNPGPLQACALHQTAGAPVTSFIPADQEWIRYSGTWGHPSSTTGRPPRGPVFQGWSHDEGRYTAWYHDGADRPAAVSSHPWLAAPTVTLSAAPDGSVTLAAATTNPAATGYGPTIAYYRIGPGAWTAAALPVAVPPGATISYLAADALGNCSPIASAARRLVVTIAGTPETHDVFPLDTRVMVNVTAVDQLTHQPVTGLPVYLFEPVGPHGPDPRTSSPATAKKAGVTGMAFPWTFASSARYVSESSGTGTQGASQVACSYYSASHFPPGYVDGGSGYGELWFVTGPPDLPAPPPTCITYPSNQRSSLASGILDYIVAHGGDPESITGAMSQFGVQGDTALEGELRAYVTKRAATLAGSALVPQAARTVIALAGRSVAGRTVTITAHR